MRLNKFARAAVAAIACTVALSAFGFGDKPLKVIVPGSPGGTIDIAARVIGQQISQDIGRPVIVENRAGATGSIGLSALLKSDPDGNTIALGPSNLLVEAPLVMKVPYDPLKDIVTVARVALTGYVLVASENYPAKDFKELTAHLKSRRGKANFASYGTGTVSQYSGLIFSAQTDLGMQHVAYLGSPAALQDVIGGQVDIMFDGLVTSLPLIKGGKVRAYAVAGKTRSRYLPDVPTMTELGYPEINFQGQVNFYGSSKLSPQVLASLQSAINKAASVPAVQQKLIDVGLEPDVSIDTAALLAEHKRLYQRNAAIVKKFDIQAN